MLHYEISSEIYYRFLQVVEISKNHSFTIWLTKMGEEVAVEVRKTLDKALQIDTSTQSIVRRAESLERSID